MKVIRDAILLFLMTALTFAAFQLFSTHDPSVLVGRIWSVREGKFISPQVLMERIASEKLILLGEIHDNREHHKLQLFVLQQMIARGARPALVMEQFDREFQDAITQEEDRPDATTESVLLAGHFKHSWGEDYHPLVALSLTHKLPIIAGNVSRDEARAIVEDPGSVSLPDVPFQVEKAIARDIAQIHCDQEIPEELLAGFVKAQRARDVMMASALERHRDLGAVLIAGVGHVRRDRGVPRYLSSRVLVVGFTEVDPLLRGPNAYVQEGPDAEEQRFDYLWFTEPAEHQQQATPKFCKQ